MSGYNKCLSASSCLQDYDCTCTQIRQRSSRRICFYNTTGTLTTSIDSLTKQASLVENRLQHFNWYTQESTLYAVFVSATWRMHSRKWKSLKLSLLSKTAWFARYQQSAREELQNLPRICSCNLKGALRIYSTTGALPDKQVLCISTITKHLEDLICRFLHNN